MSVVAVSVMMMGGSLARREQRREANRKDRQGTKKYDLHGKSLLVAHPSTIESAIGVPGHEARNSPPANELSAATSEAGRPPESTFAPD
jgi:hypothetical protein